MPTPFGSADAPLRDNLVMLMRHQDERPAAPDQLPGEPCRTRDRRRRPDHRVRVVRLAETGDYPRLAPDPDGLRQPERHPLDPRPCDRACAAGTLCRDCQRNSRRIVPSARLGGVYIQTRGPRIETVAEVKALPQFADIVGMTVASEATLACELGMEFAALCTVDNYANGLGDEVLTYDHILNTSRTHRTPDRRDRSDHYRKYGTELSRRQNGGNRRDERIFEGRHSLLITNVVAMAGRSIFLLTTRDDRGNRRKHPGSNTRARRSSSSTATGQSPSRASSTPTPTRR